jgi:hypothetical protein
MTLTRTAAAISRAHNGFRTKLAAATHARTAPTVTRRVAMYWTVLRMPTRTRGSSDSLVSASILPAAYGNKATPVTTAATPPNNSHDQTWEDPRAILTPRIKARKAPPISITATAFVPSRALMARERSETLPALSLIMAAPAKTAAPNRTKPIEIPNH